MMTIAELVDELLEEAEDLYREGQRNPVKEKEGRGKQYHVHLGECPKCKESMKPLKDVRGGNAMWNISREQLGHILSSPEHQASMKWAFRSYGRKQMAGKHETEMPRPKNAKNPSGLATPALEYFGVSKKDKSGIEKSPNQLHIELERNAKSHGDIFYSGVGGDVHTAAALHAHPYDPFHGDHTNCPFAAQGHSCRSIRTLPKGKKFDTAFSQYTLNVVDKQTGLTDVMRKMHSVLKPKGRAVFIVRRDLERNES
jgi:hypothetical protein